MPSWHSLFLLLVVTSTTVIFLLAIQLAIEHLSVWAQQRKHFKQTQKLPDLEGIKTPANWAPEPELRVPPPRQVKREYQALRLFFLIFGICLVCCLVALPRSYDIQHFAALRYGTPGHATLERIYKVYRRDSRGRHYAGLRFVVKYSPRPGVYWSADVPANASPSSVGDQVPIHYLPDKPGWISIDNDLEWDYIDLWPVPVSLFLLGCGVFLFFRDQRIKRLVRQGIPVPAQVEDIVKIAGYSNRKIATLSYEFMGQRWRKGFRVSSDGVQRGEVVTLLVDPKNPRCTLIYIESPYRAFR